MNETVIAGLTSRDDKYAHALMEKILAQSRESDEWYACLEDFAALLEHPKSYVRNRAIRILAENAKWDVENRWDTLLPSFLTHITDEKPITARQCIQALVMVGLSKPQYLPQILSSLQQADISRYPDSMRPLIQKDIDQTLAILQTKCNASV